MQQHAATPHARAGETFLLSECYASIQGESSFVGTPTIFVRLYTCNLRCAWCDSMHAVEGGDYREVTVADLATEIRRLAEAHGPRRGLRHICWTGGGAAVPGEGLAAAVGGGAAAPGAVHRGGDRVAAGGSRAHIRDGRRGGPRALRRPGGGEAGGGPRAGHHGRAVPGVRGAGRGGPRQPQGPR